jgi:hypothetical protein
MDLNTRTEFQPDQWQHQLQQFHHALLHPTDCSNPDRAHQTIQTFWTWLDQEVGPNPAGRATIVGQFLKFRDCRALGQLIDPNPELWNTPKLDLIDNSYDNYMDYGWRYTTLNELHAEHKARCAPKPINPYIIQNKTSQHQIYAAFSPSQLQTLENYYHTVQHWLQYPELNPALRTTIINQLFSPLSETARNPG